MRYSTISALLSGASLVQCYPSMKRQDAGNSTANSSATAVDFAAPPGGDATILNYALTLEYLERKFYQEGLNNFTQAQFIAAGFPDPFYANLQEIYADEQTHVSYISSALTAAGATPVSEATYAFGVTDVKSFVGLSSVLEGVGVSAYLGAAAAIVNKQYLTVAGSILTVESRHSSYIRSSLKQSPFPKAFDTPLDFNSVFSLAAQFITGFAAADGPLPFKAFPSISVSAPSTTAGSPVTFAGAQSKAVNSSLIAADTPVYAVFFSGLDTYYALTTPVAGDLTASFPGTTNSTLAPSGQVYVVLSTADGANSTIGDENTISGVGILEVAVPGTGNSTVSGLSSSSGSAAYSKTTDSGSAYSTKKGGKNSN